MNRSYSERRPASLTDVTTTAGSTGTYRDALRVGEFDAIAGSSLISILGDSAAYLAVTVLVYQRTGSALLSALTFAVAFVPYLIGGTLLSALVDRLHPRALLIGSDLVGAAVIAAIAAPGVPVPFLFVALFVIGSIAPVRSGTAGAIVADVLPGDTFVAGRSILRICAQAAQIAGIGAGGVLVAGFGPRGALLVDSASFLVSAAVIALWLRSRPARGAGAHLSLIADSMAGLRTVWNHPRIRRLLLLGWAVPFVAVAPEGLAAPAVIQSGHPAALTGLWLAAIPVGTVVGDLLTVWFVPSRTRRRMIWPLAMALPALLLCFAAGPSLPVSIILLGLTGVASAYGLGLDQTLRDITPPALLARMYAVNGTGLMVTQGLGFTAAGALAQIMPAHLAIAAAGALGVLAVLILGRGSVRKRQRERA